MEEIWKDIEGLYKVSNYGRIKSNKFGLMKQWTNKKGYCQIRLSINKKKYNKLVHRLVAQAFISNPDNKPQVNHKNGIKTDNRVENLEWNTGGENQKHSFLNGLRKNWNSGTTNGMNKLTDNEVIEIYNSKLKQRIIANNYNISQQHVSDIKTGRRCYHITEKIVSK